MARRATWKCICGDNSSDLHIPLTCGLAPPLKIAGPPPLIHLLTLTHRRSRRRAGLDAASCSSDTRGLPRSLYVFPRDLLDQMDDASPEPLLFYLHERLGELE